MSKKVCIPAGFDPLIARVLTQECEQHALLWPDNDCGTGHLS